MSDERRNALWIVSIAAASLAFSLGLACATPFAALAAIGTLQLRLRHALAAVVLAWAGNQVVGFTILHYPLSSNAFAWGAAICVASVVATIAANRLTSFGPYLWCRVSIALPVAFIPYEGMLYVASFALSSGGTAFTAPIIMRILAINALAFAVFVAMHTIAVGLGLLRVSERRGVAIA